MRGKAATIVVAETRHTRGPRLWTPRDKACSLQLPTRTLQQLRAAMRETAMLGLKELHVNVDANHPADDCMEACAWCELACLAATEACLNDLRDEKLGLCLQLSLDCAEICWTTRKFLAEAIVVAPALVREQLDSCALICAACSVECRRHAEHSYQLIACSRSCARAEQLCRDMQLRVAKLD